MADINNYSEQSGRVIGEDGTVYNVVDLLKGDFSGTGRRANIDDYAIKSGRVIGEDGGIYNIVELLQNSGGGGIGEQIQADWSEDNTQSKAYIKNKPTIPTELPAKGGSADTAKKLLTSPTGRPSTADITPDGSGGLIKFLSSGAMTTNKPNGADGHIIHMFWDNDKGYDAQMFMRCNAEAYMMIRGQSGGVWGNWKTLLDDTNINSKVLNVDYGSATDKKEIFSTTLTNAHGCWNKSVIVSFEANEEIENAPESGIARWYQVITKGNSNGGGNRAYQIAIGMYDIQRSMFIRYKHDSTWSGWITLSTPYGITCKTAIKNTNIEYGAFDIEGSGVYTVYFEEGFNNKSLPSICVSCDNSTTGISIKTVRCNPYNLNVVSSFDIEVSDDNATRVYWQAMGGAVE